jgi:DNA replication and repair protein RecF
LRIDRFSSTQFRNLNHDPVVFSPRANLFVGPNGHGKTNVLEALHFFKFGRSFRTPRHTELIHHGQPFCRIEVRTETTTGDAEKLEASIEERGTKRIKLDGKDIPRYSELVGRYPSVMFGPQDLVLVSGFPAERRGFVDMVGSMTDPVYLDELRGYRRVLKQRNAALKEKRAEEAQGVWTEELIVRGAAVTARRTAVVDALRNSLRPHIEAMRVPYSVDVVYESELAKDRPEEVSCEEQFAASLAAVEFEEIRRGITLVGPHRDDVKLLADGYDLRRYGSQGQRRLLAILLRLAELSYLEERLREPCVLLLDDLFSELDETVIKRLKALVADNRQVFVTSPAPVEWGAKDKGKLFHISSGSVTAGDSV